MGIWNSHTSIGNVLGNTIAGAFVEVIFGKLANLMLFQIVQNQSDQLGLVVHGAWDRNRIGRPHHVLPPCPIPRGCRISTRTGF